MFVEERQDGILELLRQFGKVKVKELSEKFAVTEDCIRKDMAALERRGLLKRTYGGAVPIKPVNPVNTVNTIEAFNMRNIDANGKQLIAQKAVSLIKDNSMVFLDISTVNVEIAKILCTMNNNLTIVTNMVEILTILVKAKDMRVIFTGGVLNKNNNGFCDSMARDFIARLKPDISFVGIVGINPQENSISTYDIEDGINKAMIIKVSKKSYVLAEKMKFQHSGNYNYASLDGVTGIIVDTALSGELENQLKSVGLEVV